MRVDLIRYRGGGLHEENIQALIQIMHNCQKLQAVRRCVPEQCLCELKFGLAMKSDRLSSINRSFPG
ncbi:hypothetical protein EMIT0P176_300020 [Pseudomonas sp. IT-P176]